MNAVSTTELNHAADPSGQASLLRFITAGSVDDGKSTLIGRLLFDSKGIFADQLAAVSRSKHKRTVGDTIDLSLPRSASSLSPTPRAMSSTPATW
jgi:sulfate adenylyltransferase subunit 1